MAITDQKYEVRYFREDGLISLAHARTLEIARLAAQQPSCPRDRRFEIVLNGHMVDFGRYSLCNGRAVGA